MSACKTQFKKVTQLRTQSPLVAARGQLFGVLRSIRSCRNGPNCESAQCRLSRFWLVAPDGTPRPDEKPSRDPRTHIGWVEPARQRSQAASSPATPGRADVQFVSSLNAWYLPAHPAEAKRVAHGVELHPCKFVGKAKPSG